MKIKGKKQTVFRFFLCSLAYTSTWITVSSQLSYWRAIYGPQVSRETRLRFTWLSERGAAEVI